MATTTPFSSLTKKLNNQRESFHNGSISLITDPHLVPLSKEQEDAYNCYRRVVRIEFHFYSPTCPSKCTNYRRGLLEISKLKSVN